MVLKFHNNKHTSILCMGNMLMLIHTQRQQPRLGFKPSSNNFKAFKRLVAYQQHTQQQLQQLELSILSIQLQCLSNSSSSNNNSNFSWLKSQRCNSSTAALFNKLQRLLLQPLRPVSQVKQACTSLYLPWQLPLLQQLLSNNNRLSNPLLSNTFRQPLLSLPCCMLIKMGFRESQLSMLMPKCKHCRVCMGCYKLLQCPQCLH